MLAKVATPCVFFFFFLNPGEVDNLTAFLKLTSHLFIASGTLHCLTRVIVCGLVSVSVTSLC